MCKYHITAVVKHKKKGFVRVIVDYKDELFRLMRQDLFKKTGYNPRLAEQFTEYDRQELLSEWDLVKG